MAFFAGLSQEASHKDALSCYTLYVHFDDAEQFAEEDIAEPAAFQIPIGMKWTDLQDMIHSEVGKAAEQGFVYYDDESDEVRISSQEEYETALNICRKDKRDLHIYTLRPPTLRRKQRKKRRKPVEKNKPDDEFTHLQEEAKSQDHSEPLHAPLVSKEVEERNQDREPLMRKNSSSQPEGAAAAAPPELPDESTPLSSMDPTEADEETTPMEDYGSHIARMITKEVREVIADELDDVWRFVNALKRDLNNELDIIGEQLAAHSAQLPEAQRRIRDQENQRESLGTKSQPSESGSSLGGENEEEEASYAATFICESLLDGSKVQTAENFEKHWVFRNDGNVSWDKNTKLHLLDETCDPPVASGTSLSEWGAKSKSVAVPPLKQGESGVVCAEHTAPAHGCNYISSWRLSQSSSPFGPRVWCNVRVEDEVGTSVDNQKSMGSFEDLHAEEGATARKKSLERTPKLEGSRHGSLVPEDKVKVEEKSSKPDDGLHNDNSIMSFNMTDISDGAKYLESHAHESAPYNPAVTSVEQPGEEPLHGTLGTEENVGASVDGEDHSSLSESPVIVTPPEPEEEVLHEPEPYYDEPRTLENGEETDEEEQDLYSSKYEENRTSQAEHFVENFNEPPVRAPDSEYDSSEEQEDEPEPESTPERKNSEDLHSVDYHVDDDASSMMSYASDFVVVPLPECFDVNKPLTESQYEIKEETESDSKSQEAEAEPPTSTPQSLPEEDKKESREVEKGEPRFPPEEDSSDSETESQPPSMTRPAVYHSGSSIMSTTTPKTPIETTPSSNSGTPKISLTPLSVAIQNGALGGDKEPKNEPTPPEATQPDSLNDSLTEKITKEFDAFLSNPEQPITRPSKPKIPMNQMPTSKTQALVFKPEPKPVPQSVLTMDDPYPLEPAMAPPYFPPFEQGWRRNPLPVPSSVINNDEYWPFGHNRPTPAPRHPSQVPRSEFTLDRDTQESESTLPSHPFAVASPSNSIILPDPVPAPRRPASPQIPIAEDFYPAVGTNLLPDEENEPHEADIFRTPPPSPPPRNVFELSPLDQLYEMGFHDIDLNRQIYDQCQQDLNRTVQALVLRAQADEEMAV